VSSPQVDWTIQSCPLPSRLEGGDAGTKRILSAS
jgi:hypothetical protein